MFIKIIKQTHKEKIGLRVIHKIVKSIPMITGLVMINGETM